MKLIRLISEETDGSFLSRFNVDVNIEPNSKIALKNLVMGVDLKNIKIDDSNHKITYQVRGGNPLEVFLDHKLYTENDFDLLLKNIENKLNEGMSFSGKEIGTQYQVNGSGQRLAISTKTSSVSSKADWKNNIPTFNGTPVMTTTQSGLNTKFTNNLNLTNTNIGKNIQMTFLGDTICKANAFFRVKINTLADDVSALTTGFIIGITKTNPSALITGGTISADTFTTNRVLAGIEVNRQANIIQLLRDGNATNATGSPTLSTYYAGANNTNNPIVAIEKHGAIVKARLYYNDSGATNFLELGTFENITDATTANYYPVMIMRSATQGDLTLENINITLDSFDSSISHTTTDHIDLGVVSPPRTTSRASPMYIQFNSINLANRLGYIYNSNPFPISNLVNVKEFLWNADNDFDIASKNDNYLVVLESSYVEAYDGLSKGQKSIICVMPVMDDISVIRFNAQYPIFINLKNDKKMSLKNIKLRVLNSDNTFISSVGLSSATLLIDN